MSILILSLAMAILNALRGSGRFILFNRWSVCLYAGLIALSITHNPVQALIVSVGIFLGLLLGWGKYLNLFSGNLIYKDETEVKVIDFITDRICGKPTTSHNFKRWCLVAMSLRGLLFYPLFAGLGYFHPQAFYIGAGCLLMGLSYKAASALSPQYQVRGGEFIWGGVLGSLIGMAL